LPDNLPPLDTHFPGQNGVVLLCYSHGSPLTSAASCRECMASEPQDNSVEAGNATMTMPSAEASSPELMASEPQGNSAEVADAPITIPRKGKKRRCASSGVVPSESLIFIEKLR
jgi:hypothetical protein